MVQSAEVFSRVCTIFGSNLVQKAERQVVARQSDIDFDTKKTAVSSLRP